MKFTIKLSNTIKNLSILIVSLSSVKVSLALDQLYPFEATSTIIRCSNILDYLHSFLHSFYPDFYKCVYDNNYTEKSMVLMMLLFVTIIIILVRLRIKNIAEKKV